MRALDFDSSALVPLQIIRFFADELWSIRIARDPEYSEFSTLSR